MKFEELFGKTITKIVVSDDKETVTFTDNEGNKYQMYHFQDCCESVYVEDITGDLNDLLNTPIIKAEENTSEEDFECGSLTWTFYNIATVKGHVTIRWYGESNGYYSEDVSFIKL